jgi:hypothetical protein
MATGDKQQTKVTWRDVDPDLRACDCIVPESEAFTIEPATDGTVAWTAPPLLDRNASIEVVSKPDWVRLRIRDQRLSATGVSDGEPFCSVVRIVTPCGEATWSLTFAAPCRLPVATSSTRIVTDSTGQTVTEIRLAAEGEVVDTTGLDGAYVSAFGATLVISGEVRSGPYSVRLSSPCGETVVEGVIEREEIPAPPPCNRLRLVDAPALTTLTINEYTEVCYRLSGTSPIDIDSFEDLPLGLNPEIRDSPTGPLLCLVGTPLWDKCLDDPEGCRVGKVSLSNCAGQFEVPIRLYVSRPPQPRPPFCVGMVLTAPTASPIPPGFTGGMDVKAVYFPANTVLTVGVAVVGDSTLEGDIGASVPVSDTEIELDIEGYGEKTVFYNTTGSGCAQAYLYAKHPTCAVVSNFSILSPISNILNDCDDTSGGG